MFPSDLGEIPLPPMLASLPQPLLWALTALLTSWLFALFLRFVILRIAQIIALRSEGEWEDVLIAVSQRPLLLAILLVGLIVSINALQIDQPLIIAVQRWLVAALMAVVTYWVWRVVKEVVLHYGERLARRSETRLDDVLLPIVNQFAPIAIFLIGGGVILQQLGVRLDALLVAIGGAAFILAFALQDILSNVFSGISLLVDTPFRFGDLVTLQDGHVCQVQKIGVRVTQLYNIYDHAVIYMPNSQLANERLTNLMQPTPELFSSVRLEVDRDQQVELILAELNHILNGHPDLLGNIEAKLEAIPSFALLSEEKRRHGVKRLAQEKQVDELVRSTSQGLKSIAAEIQRQEIGGISKAEREQIIARAEPVLNVIGTLPDLKPRLDRYQGETSAFLDEVQPELGERALAAVVWCWIRIWAQDPDLEPGSDDARLREKWATTLLSLLRRTEDLRQRIEKPNSLDLRLNDAVLDLNRWLLTSFKQPIPPWKCSGASFKGFQEGAFVFYLYFLVDNIELEHFFRRSRVEGEVQREIARRFREQGISFASRHHQVNLLESTPNSRP